MSMPVNSGTLAAAAVNFGPTNSEFTINKVTGQTSFPVGTPTPLLAEQFPLLGNPVYSTLPSTNISSTTKQQDAVQLLNNWISTYILDSPPPVTGIAGIKDTSRISISFVLPPQKKLAFTAIATTPYISALKADVILSSDNADKSWTGSKTTLTLESPAANAFATCNQIDLLVQGGTSQLLGTVYQARNVILTQTSYDIRIYSVNNSSELPKYSYVYGIQTDSVGPPAAPTGLGFSSIAQSTATAAWTAPADRDANLAGTQTSPFVASYRVDRNTVSSLRYGGAIADTVSTTTPTTTVSDATTTVGLTSLQPGTNYSAVVSAKNTINPGYGTASSPAAFLTLNPTSTSFLGAGDCTALDSTQLATLRAPYLASGGYTLGGLVAPVLINSVNMTDTNVYVTYSGLRRTNFTVGATGTVGSLVGYAGPSASYFSDTTNSATFSAQGFGTTSPDGSVTSSAGTAQVLYRGDGDQYSSPVYNTGFYKVINATALAFGVATNFVPSSTGYSLRLQYTPVGGTVSLTNQVEFFVDGLSATTTVNNTAITAESGSNTTQISGVPSFTPSASFKLQHNQTNVASYFVRSDRKHADLSITNTAGSSTVGAVVSILSTSMGASHKYYSAPSTNKYTTSSALSNTSGTQLAYTLTPPEIQFNDFLVPLTSASTLFDEGLQAKVTPFSNFTNGGTPASAGFVDPSTGSSKSVRIDAPSITVKNVTLANASSAIGQQVSSGTGLDPASSAYTPYDHTQSLLSNSDMQLLNGRFVTPSGDVASYKNYGSFWPGSSALPTPDYSSITSSQSTLRYVTFKYSGLVTAGQSKIQVAVVSTGLTLGTNLSSSNHTFTVMVVDSAQPTGNMNCNSAIAGSGLGSVSPVPSGTPCGDISSTAASRKFYIPAGASTSAVLYIRVGVASNIAATITSCTVSAVTSFT